MPLTAKEALAVRKAAPTIRAADNLKGIKKNVALDKAFQAAREVISDKFPDLSKSLVQSEKSITASQLRMPLPVKRTNPNQVSGLATLIGSGFGLVNPKLVAGLGLASPLSMGIAGALMGEAKKSVPKVARRAIQRTGSQALVRALGGE